MKIGDLVRFRDWHGGFVGKIIAIDTEEPDSWLISWLIGSSVRVYESTYAFEDEIEVVHESR